MSELRIAIAATAAEIARCFPVLHELRPQLEPETFVAQVQRLQQQGYELAYLSAGGEVRAIAGFRCAESLAWGRYLYLDDLVARAGDRRQGYGRQLLAWLRDQARQRGCQQLHLDSGCQRTGAHHFYQKQGFAIAGYHFAQSLEPNTNP